MEYVKVELNDVIINGLSKGSVIEILKDTAHRLIYQGHVRAVTEDTPVNFILTADKSVQVLRVTTNTVKAT